jgi:transposase
MAAQMPSKSVAVKTEAQQAVLALHRMRQQKLKFRTMQINSLRGLLTEYGEVMGKSRAALDKAIPHVLARLADRLPAMLIESLREQWHDLENLDRQIADIERRLLNWMKENDACKAVAEIPGVGLLTATAAVATMGDAKSFKSGREFAAWLGLVPAQTGTGGKVQLLGISKRGDTYLRTLLVHGARSVLHHAKDPSEWLKQISLRRCIRHFRPPPRRGASDKQAAYAVIKASRLCRSVGRSAEAAATRTRLAQSQAPGTHCCLTTAVTPANPQAISSVSIGRQLAEYLAAPQSR